MSLFVLDTDLLTLYYRGDPIVVRAVDARSPADLAISVMTVDERCLIQPEPRRQRPHLRRLVSPSSTFAMPLTPQKPSVHRPSFARPGS